LGRGICLSRHESAIAADVPGSGGVAHRTPVDLPTGGLRLAQAAGPALAGLLVVVWLAVDPHTPDLAAQVYRVGLFRQLGFAVWDEHWYAGHHLPGYSLLFPALGTLLGVRTVGALCAVLSTVLFGALAVPEHGRTGGGWGTAAFAVGAVGDVWLGRLAFALGVSLALASVLAYRRDHRLVAGVLAALSAAASPVAGMLLGLAALTASVSRRSPRALLVLAVPAAAVVLPLSVLFPEGGSEPFPLLSFVVTAAIVAVFWVALPREFGLLRTGAIVYLLACVACLLVHSPIGSNIERYGVLLAAPLLLCALLDGKRQGAGLTIPGLLALAAIAVWVLWGPVRETEAVSGSGATSAAYYEPLERFLDGLHEGPLRIEVPLTRTHWEAALLAPRVSLARGWEKQLDVRYDGVLLRGGLDAASYRAWLAREGVAYVALPDVQLDPSSAREGRLVAAGLPYLHLAFRSRHWRVYRVLGATPLVSGPARLTSLGHDSFALSVSRAGPIVVREHFTRYWTLTAGRGCVGRGPEGLTEVRAAAPGRIVVAARFSFSRALGSGSSCRGV
jgi:hypothetical protein